MPMPRQISHAKTLDTLSLAKLMVTTSNKRGGRRLCRSATSPLVMDNEGLKSQLYMSANSQICHHNNCFQRLKKSIVSCSCSAASEGAQKGTMSKVKWSKNWKITSLQLKEAESVGQNRPIYATSLVTWISFALISNPTIPISKRFAPPILIQRIDAYSIIGRIGLTHRDSPMLLGISTQPKSEASFVHD